MRHSGLLRLGQPRSAIMSILPLVAAYLALESLWLAPELEPKVVKDHQEQLRAAWASNSHHGGARLAQPQRVGLRRHSSPTRHSGLLRLGQPRSAIMSILPLVAAYPALESLWLAPELEPKVVKDHQEQLRAA